MSSTSKELVGNVVARLKEDLPSRWKGMVADIKTVKSARTHEAADAKASVIRSRVYREMLADLTKGWGLSTPEPAHVQMLATALMNRDGAVDPLHRDMIDRLSVLVAKGITRGGFIKVACKIWGLPQNLPKDRGAA